MKDDIGTWIKIAGALTALGAAWGAIQVQVSANTAHRDLAVHAPAGNRLAVIETEIRHMRATLDRIENKLERSLVTHIP